MNCERVVKNIQNHAKDYIVNNNLKSLVIGISGGIDSCLSSALLKPVCDELNIKLIGRSLPIVTNKSDEIARANMVGREFCHDYKEVSLETQFDIFNNITVAMEGK
jgi:NH3-dependent NAD+ synthetase